MARGGHGLAKVSPGPTKPYPSTPYRRATPETAVSGMTRPLARRSTALFYPFGHPTPYAHGPGEKKRNCLTSSAAQIEFLLRVSSSPVIFVNCF
jgi:hypothetical protein